MDVTTPRAYKKLRRSAPSTGVNPSVPVLDNTQPMSIKQLPEEDFKSILLYCDVLTRCRLRRVCRYWKHISCLPDISETVLVDRRCLTVSVVGRRSRRIWSHRSKDNKPTTPSSSRESQDPRHHQDPISANYLGQGWHYANESGVNPRRLRRTLALSDHQRHGILGPHVRAVVYHGAMPNHDSIIRTYTSVVETIRSVARYCTNLQQIILWRIIMKGWPKQSGFGQAHLPTGLPAVERVVVLDSTLVIGWVQLPVMADIGGSRSRFLARKVDRAVVTAVQPSWLCTEVELAWVTKYASSLPERYHEWAKRGIKLDLFSGTKALPRVDLLILPDHDYLLALTVCIVQEKVHPDWDPPPASLAPMAGLVLASFSHANWDPRIELYPAGSPATSDSSDWTDSDSELDSD